ncbi:GNAT family N-acetyltransferase [Acinetobacter sp.]|uniref:GNAT family N-acetyltransferase n=1 Tax=Acinetobacter sp. TaxID=472 RepID=UPI0038908A6E
MHIQRLDRVQYTDWLVLWECYQAFYQTCLTEDVNELTWQRLTDSQIKQMYGFAAIREGKIVGMVHMIEHDSCWTAKPYAYLQDLYVAETYRNRGVARKLIQHVGEHCQKHCDRVYWLTQQQNAQARALYDQLGKIQDLIQYRM